MKKLLYFLSVIIVFNFTACSDDDPDSYFSVTPTELSKVSYNGGKIVFTIDSDADWSYGLSDESWIKENSKDKKGLILDVYANTLAEERSATVTFTSPSTSNKYEIKITQAGMIISGSGADLLDIIFKADGTAEDFSPLKNVVTTVEGSAMSTMYSNTYQRYIANFTHGLASSMYSGYYKIDYDDNQSFKDAIADGHTLEAMFMLDVDNSQLGQEIKMFSSHQGGGTGLMIGKAERGNSIIFLPHVGGGYKWANSGVTPERGKYYHVVGVWNKEEGKAYVYVNGEMKGEIDAKGDFKFASDGCRWFTVGGDPASATQAQSAWRGNVNIARVYDKPLTAEDVEGLWNQVKDFQPAVDEIQLQGVSFVSKRVKVNTIYKINGEGFTDGDKIKMASMKGGKEYELEGTVNGNALEITLPKDLVTDQYRFFVLRGSKILDIGFATLTVVENMPDAPQIIAHRGFFVQADGAAEGVAENSVAALAEAQRIGAYGSEFDVYITKDDKLVIYHDGTIQGVTIEDANYDQIKDFTIGSGNHVEKLPTLEDYLAQGKKNTKTKLILELKGKAGNMNRLSEACVKAVRDAGMVEYTEYIAFNIDVCKKIRELEPTAVVAYLNGDLSPQELKPLGIDLDYRWSVIKSNPKWLIEAQELGLKVNVWTLNSEGDLQEAIDMGVDFITTDYPVLTQRLIGQ